MILACARAEGHAFRSMPKRGAQQVSATQEAWQPVGHAQKRVERVPWGQLRTKLVVQRGRALYLTVSAATGGRRLCFN